MGDEASGQEAGKPKKRTTVKSPVKVAASKVKSTIHLSLEASQRLDIHATMMGFDRSALVEKLINENLRRFVVSDRDRGRTEESTGEEAA